MRRIEGRRTLPQPPRTRHARSAKGVMIAAAAFAVIAFGIVFALAPEDDRSPTPTATPAAASNYTHHNCVKVAGRVLYNGVNLRTGTLDQPVDADRCTDITWEDGRRIFNIVPSEVERLIQYR